MALRVALIADLFPPAICGVGDYTDRLARALAGAGAEVTVITRHLPGVLSTTNSAGVRIQRIARTWTIADLAPILRTVRSLGPGAVVHLQYPSKTGYQRQVMINVLPAVLRMVREKPRVVVTLHEFHERSRLWRVRVAPMLAVHDALVFVRQVDRTAASSWCWPHVAGSTVIPIASNIPVIPVEADARQALRLELGFRPEQQVVVFFGGVYPDKGVLMLVEACDRIQARGVDAGLLMIGEIGSPSDASLPVNPAIADHHRIVLSRLDGMLKQGNARIARAPTPERVSRLLGVGDLAVFPFLRGASENRGSLIAAIEHGLPVLTTRGPSTPDRFEDDFGVQTVAAGDGEALATQMALLITSPDMRLALRRRAAAASTMWSWPLIARKTLEVYERIREE